MYLSMYLYLYIMSMHTYTHTANILRCCSHLGNTKIAISRWDIMFKWQVEYPSADGPLRLSTINTLPLTTTTTATIV